MANVGKPLVNSGNVDMSQSEGIVREIPGQKSLLPSEKVFPVQIGSELFRLSGASITSDAPSYFTQFFEEQIRESGDEDAVRTLYIDRDPVIFRDIARHLQGYYLQPLDGTHYVRLFADAQFYSLPRLISQLFDSETFIRIGDRDFQVPRAFFSSPQAVFPGLERTGLLRPPPVAPPSVPSRSADVFAQLLHLLRGYPLHIRDEDHRAELLRDCRYFHLRGVEQRLIPHELTYNPYRQSSEILLRLEYVKPSGISFVENKDGVSDASVSGGQVHYTRPFVDSTPHELILEVGSEPAILNLRTNEVTFRGLTEARISALLQVIRSKVGRAGDSPPDLKLRFEMNADTDLILNGKATDAAVGHATQKPNSKHDPQSKKRKLDTDIEPEVADWEVRTGHWRLRVQQEGGTGSLQIVFMAAKLDALTCERARNARRKFLN